jgi:predicted DNA-binding protein with PD1-like motif
MRRIAQPGPTPEDRIQWVEARGRHVAFTLVPGRRLLDAAREGFAIEGFAGGVLRLEGGALGPFAYVMPALSRDGRNAAFYSDTFRPSGRGLLHSGALTLGLRDGAPFFHCHAFWTEVDGTLRGGHLLPEDTVIAEPIPVSGIGLAGVTFAAEPDAETNFTLLKPVAQPTTASREGRLVFALRLCPNQDTATALETFCRERGISQAVLHGGVGSIIGARFTDGRRVVPFATEMALRAGVIQPDPYGNPIADLEAVLVDLSGSVTEGNLVRGDNPILMTLEAVLDPEPIRSE